MRNQPAFSGAGRTLGVFSEDILTLLKGRIRESTLGLYSASLRSLKRCVGDQPVNSLSVADFEAFLARRLAEVSAVRSNIELRALRAMFNRACVCRMLLANPIAGVRPVRIVQREPRSLTRREFSRLLSTISDPAFRSFVIIAVCTAMRAGELASLRWADVDLRRRVIHLRNRDGFVTKGRKGRDIPINRQAEQAFRSLARRSESVFVNRRGRPHTSHSLSVRFKGYVRRAGLSEEIHLHCLRHTGASWMVERKVPLAYVKEILGHSSINTTMIYVHCNIDHLRSSLCQLDSLFPG